MNDALMAVVERTTTGVLKLKETVNDDIFPKYTDTQPGVLIQVFKWESGMTENNNLLGKFHLDGILSAHVACLRRSTSFSTTLISLVVESTV